MDAPPVKKGDILAGKYRVDRVIGAGGMGVVVAATHIDLREPRALKFMRAMAISDGEAVERFLREGRASSRLRGEHVARVYDVGRLDDGAPFMVMEFLSGDDLRAVLKQRGQLPVGEAMLYLLQACEALAEAHALGIVHRDLKPANLFLTRRADGTPCIKVLDFGISKILGDGHSVTKSYAILGSPYYMSPEQMRSSRDVDARTDVWSLGVIAYQLLSGGLPFSGRTITEIITVVLQGEPDPPSSLVPGLPPALDAAILRCLERDLGRRHASVGELAAALMPFAPPEAERSFDAITRLVGLRRTIPRSRPAPGPAVEGPPIHHALPPPEPPGSETVTVARSASTTPMSGSGAWGSTAVRLGTSRVGLAIAGTALGVLLGYAAFKLMGRAPVSGSGLGSASPTTLVPPSEPVVVPSAPAPPASASAAPPPSAGRSGGSIGPSRHKPPPREQREPAPDPDGFGERK
jgi:serine/threonine protein kinase